jgi:threonine/homoserine/homoserine lactone efflux protein
MTLAMVLGMSIGIRKTLWMMWGELIGVAIVAVSSVIGVSAIMLELPQIFDILKFIGAGYLFYIGINMWRSKGKLAISINNSSTVNTNKGSLFYQGFITAIANPKGWAFMISLLPPFINTQYALAPQLSVLITIILVSEFTCMMLYAAGGKTIGKVFTEQNNVKYLNRLSGTLMILVALWLAAS